MDKDNTRNTVIFFVCAFALMALYQVFIMGPMAKRQQAQQAQAKAAAVQQAVLAKPTTPTFVARTQALTASPRVMIDTPAVKGSISLRGAKLDDLFLKGYRETVAKDSPPVELFRPEGAQDAYFTDFGWIGGAPTSNAVWTAPAGATLSPGHPVTLNYDNGQGLKFDRTFAVDDKFMFTVADTVTNTGAATLQLAPYASVQRWGRPTPMVGIFEGAIGSQKGLLDTISYKDMKEKGGKFGETHGGWVGLTDKYWMSALIPPQGETFKTAYRITSVGPVDVYEANYVGTELHAVAPGQSVTETRHLFAGAKRAQLLETYQKDLGLTHFIDAIDWGVLWFLTRPIFWLLQNFMAVTGSVGISIMLLTIVRVILTFPLYNKSFASAAEMRKLQPELEAIKKQYKDDPAKVQQATMELYKERKVNFLAGCVPALVPIPIFFALSKVFTVSLELRHASFLGVPDLSAPDPTTFVNLFGLIPWHVETTPLIGSILAGPLHIGMIAILYGLTQWLLQAMSPQTAGIDPVQKQIFMFMPLVITFFMAQVATGLLIYWVWSTLLTLVQQYVIMRRHKTDNPIDTFIAKVRSASAPAKA